MTEAIARSVGDNRLAVHNGSAGALNFAIAALLAHRAAQGVSPYEGLDVELLFSALQMLAQRSDLEVAAFVQAWQPALDARLRRRPWR